MVESNQYLHGVWKGPWYFIGAMICASAGLGALWYFPSAAGGNVGLVSLLFAVFLVLVSWPLLVTEVMLGRRGRQSAINGLRYLVRESQQRDYWRAIGWLGTLAGVLMVSWFSLLAVWAGDYFWDMTSGVLQGQSLRFASEHFAAMESQPRQALLRCGLFLLLTAAVLAGGVARIGRILRHLVAVLLGLLVLAAGLSVFNGNWASGYDYLFDMSLVDVDRGQWLKAAATALTMAFVCIPVGVGAAMTLGAYLPERPQLAKGSLLVVLVAGLVTFVVALSIHATLRAEAAQAVLEGQAGSGLQLLFVSLPVSFSNTSYGLFLGGLFYLFIALACWGAAIALLEPAVAWLTESTRCNRFFSSLIVILVCLGLMPTTFFTLDKGDYGAIEWFCRHCLVPLVALMVVLFAGYCLRRDLLREMLYDESRTLFSICYGLLRYILPVAMVIIFSLNIYLTITT
ncbi:hypothetical protein QSV34_08175 [Porticoccus sp. W117]|uniref:hypothetical protein n=1 Tax=Porticoccus sp. W117 TaxID=3054777 RepID=UPI0025960102|nr:hypothetical protein [Porticoccus sp. W117]MDM3871330.1 hypothetical protein [Porticoccus sp. W117]